MNVRLWRRDLCDIVSVRPENNRNGTVCECVSPEFLGDVVVAVN